LKEAPDKMKGAKGSRFGTGKIAVFATGRNGSPAGMKRVRLPAHDPAA